MGKNKKENKSKKDISSNSVKNIDDKILAREIIKAYAEYECNKKAEEEKKEQEIQEEWLNIIGQKKYPENENWFLKQVHHGRNTIVGLYKLLFFKRKDAKDPRATFALMGLATVTIFSMCMLMLYFCAIAFVYGIFKQKIRILPGCFYTFIFWTLARFFRMAAFEVENIRDGNLLIAIFSGALSFVGIVIAVVTLLIDKF